MSGKGFFQRGQDRPQKSLQDHLSGAPPHDLEAEKALIGSILLDPTIAPAACRALKPSQFYSPTYRKIYEAMKELVGGHMVVDISMLVARLKLKKETPEIFKDGAEQFFIDLIELVPAAVNWPWFVKRIIDTYRLRVVIYSATEVLQTAYDPDRDADTIVNASLDQLLHSAAKIRQETDLADVRQFSSTFADLEKRARFPEQHRPVASGWNDLDQMIGGWFGADLIVIGARPSMGKTACITQTAMHAAKLGDPVLFVSLEMPRVDVEGRVICQWAGVSHHMARQGKVSNIDLELMRQATQELEQTKILFDDRPDQTVQAIASGARICQQRLGGCAMIVVDYLQIVEPTDRRMMRDQQITAIAKGLKDLAKDLKVPVIAAAQIKRTDDKEKERRPRMSDLRESGGIEAAADVIILLHREEYYRPGDNTVRGKAEFIVAKQRMGPTGTVVLRWDGRLGQFHDRSYREPGDDSYLEEQGTFFEPEDASQVIT